MSADKDVGRNALDRLAAALDAADGDDAVILIDAFQELAERAESFLARGGPDASTREVRR